MNSRRALIVAALVFITQMSVAAAQRAEWAPKVRAWVSGNQQRIVAELIELLSIPNVAADRVNIRRNAEHLRGLLEKRGFRAELLETQGRPSATRAGEPGNPLVYGELQVPGANRTLLLYFHYDGQPVDPKRWAQPDPFKPVIRDGRIYARSAADDKAPIVAMLSAVDALRASGLAPSSNIRVIMDGEEEAGSPSLVPAINQYREKFAADLMVILDGPEHSSGRPTIAYGARGIARVDLTVFGPKVGVHSGNYGNWVPNPAQRLALLLASMKDEQGRILIEGFNDAVEPLTPEERSMLDAVPEDAESMLRTFGIAAPEVAYPKLQTALQYPTLNVRGMTSAFVGSSARTIIPDRATASIDIRLVKETAAADMVEKLRAHVRRQGYHITEGAPDDAARATHSKIAAVVVVGESVNAFRTPPSDPQVRALAAAIRAALGVEPVHLRTLGGTVPITPFIQALGFPAVLVPTVNFDNNQHEENENLRLSNLFEAVVKIAAILRM